MRYMWTRDEKWLPKSLLLWAGAEMLFYCVALTILIGGSYLLYMEATHPSTDYYREYTIENIGTIQKYSDRHYSIVRVEGAEKIEDPIFHIFMSGVRECKPLFLTDLQAGQRPWLYIREVVKGEDRSGPSRHIRYDSIVFHVAQTPDIVFTPR